MHALYRNLPGLARSGAGPYCFSHIGSAPKVAHTSVFWSLAALPIMCWVVINFFLGRGIIFLNKAIGRMESTA